jgi:hypothetical protein
MDTYGRWKKLGQPAKFLVECWRASQSADPGVAQRNSWAFMEPVNDVSEAPEKSWEYVVILGRDPTATDHELGLMAAGALEDLLTHHGLAFIDRVEQEARANPRFAHMLGGVCRSQITDNVLQRVQAVWNPAYWQQPRAEA